MDSRDIIEKPTKNTYLLEDMYSLQKNLLEKYIKIEGLPQYPINVNKKTNQLLIKDLTARVTEELAEGYESLNEVWKITQAQQYWLEDPNDSAYPTMLNHLQNFGEELSDALHFFIELLIYINIEPADIIKYLKSINIQFHGDDLLQVLLDIGGGQVEAKYIQEYTLTHNEINLLKFHSDYGSEVYDERYYIAGSKISSGGMELQKKLLWDITYHLNISRNFLKNKPWKQSEEMTAETQYQTEVIKAFMALMGYLKFVGCTQHSVYFLYFKKNKVNQFRIKSNY